MKKRDRKGGPPFDEDPATGQYTDGTRELWAMILLLATLFFNLFFA
ncbi:hypothetical protein [Larkinella humicola]|nr:hypothetical protein [Larkinella humicola]